MALYLKSITICSRQLRVRATASFLRYSSTQSKTSTMANQSNKIFTNITKSPCDKREYRGLILNNNMRVLLISDPATDKSAAALSVCAGSMNDPNQLPGLAHFCEHMLFLGTQKYPQENDYSKFLSDNGGSSNAYTAKDHTCYFFDVKPHGLEGALDRFSQFFICPLFTESAAEREVNAVHSEHEKNIPSDSWRAHQIEVTTSSPNHDYGRFSTGDRNTLWILPNEQSLNVRKELLDFHHKYYSANLMNLTVLGSQNLDELQQIVETRFSEVENRHREIPVWHDNPYGPEQCKKQIEIVPIKDHRHINIMFPVPDTSSEYKSTPERYVSHLLGHEGVGSLLSLLKEKNWVNQLSAGCVFPARKFSVFKIDLDLTPEGLKEYKGIILHVFQYLEMLNKLGPQKWIWEEMRDINALMFRFKEKERPQSYVRDLSRALHEYPLEDVLTAGHIITEYDPERISDILNSLNPENCRVTLISKEFNDKTKLTEKYYGVNYNYDGISEDVIKTWKNCGTSEALKLPKPNEFIPTKFDLKPRDEHKGIVPRIICDSKLSRVWYLQDNEFFTPRAMFSLELCSNLPMIDPVNRSLNHLFSHAVNDILTEITYPASCAELNYSVSGTDGGLQINCDGYDEKVGLLLRRVLEKIVNFSYDEKRFEVAKDTFKRNLKNFLNEQPYSHAIYFCKILLKDRGFTNDELLEAVDDLTVEMLHDYVKKFLSALKFEWLVYGNVTLEEASSIVESSQKFFIDKGVKPLLPSQISKCREVNIPPGYNYLYRSEHQTHSSSCTNVYFQSGLESPRETVTLELLEHIASEPCFNQLRTKEQLGYVVLSNVRHSNGTQGIQFLVQSDRHPLYVEERIESFLNSYKALLKDMKEEEFLQHRSALAAKKAETPKKLKIRGKMVWKEINSQMYSFDRQKVELSELDKVTLDDLKAFCNEIFEKEGKRFKRLSIHIISMTDDGAGKKSQGNSECNGPKLQQELIEDVSSWKKQHGLYASGKSDTCIPNFKKNSKL